MDIKDHITKELQDMPLLLDAKKALKESVPTGYFSELADGVIMTESNSDSLTTYKQDIQQSIPDGYFENLADSVIDIVHNEEGASHRSTLRIWPMAAAIALLVVASFYLFNLTATGADTTASSEETMDAFLAYNIDDIDDEILLSDWSMSSDIDDEELELMDEEFLLDDILLEELL